MWPMHVYRTPSKPLPGWLFGVMFWLIMPAAIVCQVCSHPRPTPPKETLA